MGFYNVINPSSMQSGQPEDVSQILANLQAIAGILNGGLDNANIAPLAAIDYAKLNLALQIKNADINDTAAILGHKLGWSVGANPPASPQAGDIWILPITQPVGAYQMYLYDAAEAGSFKWKFIGGSPYLAYSGSAEGTAGSGLFAGPSLTLLRNGDYMLSSAMNIHQLVNANTIINWGLSIRKPDLTSLSGAAEAWFQAPSSNTTVAYTLTVSDVYSTGLPANQILRMYASVFGWDMTTTWRKLSAIPIRVI